MIAQSWSATNLQTAWSHRRVHVSLTVVTSFGVAPVTGTYILRPLTLQSNVSHIRQTRPVGDQASQATHNHTHTRALQAGSANAGDVTFPDSPCLIRVL
jgi:hypothetical protein